jgi:hypothetical protein
MRLELVGLFGAAGVLATCIAVNATAEEAKLPAFCAQVSAESMKGISIPYGIRESGGVRWCEGTLPVPLAVRTLKIVSVQQADAPPAIQPNTAVELKWCPVSAAVGKASPAQLNIRSVDEPLFGLNAAPEGNSFRWPSDMFARFRRDWKALGICAKATVQLTPQLSRDVILPTRVSAETTGEYSFLVESLEPIELTNALVESVSAGAKHALRPTQGKTAIPTVSDLRLSLNSLSEGIYRISFNEGIAGRGRTTEGIYVWHSLCAPKKERR